MSIFEFCVTLNLEHGYCLIQRGEQEGPSSTHSVYWKGNNDQLLLLNGETFHCVFLALALELYLLYRLCFSL